MDHWSREGLRFEVRDSGDPEAETVVLLHGFPETGASWDKVAPGLVSAGYRVLAPDQRGYSPGARPDGRRAYRLAELVDDVLSLADAAGIDRFHLVGHDWGGGVAWEVATRHPERLLTLSVLSTPHPRALLRSLVRSSQALHSWYMLFFQLPRLPEALIRAGGSKALVRSGLPEELAVAYTAVLVEPGALTGAVNWYRALPFVGSQPRRPEPVTVPTLYVWSSGDRFLSRAAAEATGRYVSAPYRFEILEGVSHWIPELAPAEVVRLLVDQFASAG
jgi:pimeloyl-ACP methyl ester carboxylesterase